MRRVMCLGDIHGGYRSLKQVFERSSFDYEKDKLICLGDGGDGWPETKKVFDELLKIKDLVYVIGNHCCWLLDYALNGNRPMIWVTQGGFATLDSYEGKPIPIEHVDLLKNAPYYYELDNNLFVHGGLDLNIKDISHQKADVLTWDRNLLETAKKWHYRAGNRHFTEYDEIFLGHTTTSVYNSLLPLHYCNVWDLDTGGGFEGKLTIMDIESKQYWQSDKVSNLYPEVKGR